jgi:hypothetical protein
MAFRRALDTQRRTGADPAGHRSGAAHGTAMEGYYWRVVDPGAGAVMVVLCGVCRGPGGPWAAVALAVACDAGSRDGLQRHRLLQQPTASKASACA